MTHALNLYLARDPMNRLEPRLIVARRIEQVVPMVSLGMSVEHCTAFQAYRYGKLGIGLEYAKPRYGEPYEGKVE